MCSSFCQYFQYFCFKTGYHFSSHPNYGINLAFKLICSQSSTRSEPCLNIRVSSSILMHWPYIAYDTNSTPCLIVSLSLISHLTFRTSINSLIHSMPPIFCCKLVQLEEERWLNGAPDCKSVVLGSNPAPPQHMANSVSPEVAATWDDIVPCAGL